MPLQLLSSWAVGDAALHYFIDPAVGQVGLRFVPAARLDRIAVRRADLSGLPYIDSGPEPVAPPASILDPLVHLKLVGDAYPGAFCQGHTMRCAPTNNRFIYKSQHDGQDGNRSTVITTLVSTEGLRIEHRVSWTSGIVGLVIESSFHNDSTASVTLEMLSSFSLGGLSPFAADDAPGRLMVHRYRSGWSAEGRLESRTVENLHLERSWSGAGAFSERYGQIGTMPVRKWFPFVAVEDTIEHVTWAAQLGWAGSWQLEIFRQHDDLCISGGHADREFGQWMKTVAPGESITTPAAHLVCAAGGLDEACDRLTAMQVPAVEAQPAVEQDLPIIFNEWCTTWGDPSQAKLTALADRLQGTDVRYLVIDAGWYKTETSDWSSGHGDWIPSDKLFPDGIAAAADAIRARGLIPGLWFEMETVGENSSAFTLLSDHMIQRDGLPVTVRQRRFWDLNDPVALDYLAERVIDLLEAGRFGYLKVDYNETAGLGCDHPDGQGEGLRNQILGTYRFFQKIRERLPELVIENCSSGGHRLEPSMMALTAMSSFSDAHELVEIPLIAANLHHLILPRQNQIWAVLKASDDERRLVYSLAATFLGRMCLSGEVDKLTPQQWTVVERAMTRYRDIAPILKDGVSRKHGDIGPSWRYPTGWQALVRVSGDSRQALVVAHAYDQAPASARVPLPDNCWKIAATFSEQHAVSPVLGTDSLTVAFTGPFSAQVIHLIQAP